MDDSSRDHTTKGVAARWPGQLGERFCPVSSFFLKNYHRLSPHPGARGLSSSEAMVIIQLLDHKWDKRDPFPTVGTVADRMGMSDRGVRGILSNLEKLGYVERVATRFGPNRYRFDGLYAALEELMARDGAAAA